MTVPNRRGFRWSLRTLFVVVTLIACWLGYHLNWIRQRHDALMNSDIEIEEGRRPAPFALRMLGAPPGYQYVWVVLSPEKVKPPSPPLTNFDTSPEENERVNAFKRLFPEAEVGAHLIRSEADKRSIRSFPEFFSPY